MSQFDRRPAQNIGKNTHASGGGSVGKTTLVPPVEGNSAKIGADVFKSPRFMGDPILERVAAGGAVLQSGDIGPAVGRLQAALADAGHLAAATRTGVYSHPTVIAVKVVQGSHALPDTGIVDSKTLAALDSIFADHTRYADIARSKKPPTAPSDEQEYAHGASPHELLVGTSPLSPAEAREANDVLSPIQAVDKRTGQPVIFKEEGYKTKLTTLINEIIDFQFASIARGKAELHAEPANLHPLSDVAVVGQVSKKKTDNIFGAYATGPAFNASTNLRDRWATEDKKIKGLEAKHDNAGLAAIAKWRVRKILSSSPVVKLNKEHGAIISRSHEKTIIDEVVGSVAAARGTELREIQKGWPGAADQDTGEVFMQVFRGADAVENRKFMWKTFQTLIHEYLHTINHSRYIRYANNRSTTDMPRGHTLREGVTDFLTTAVLSTVNYTEPTLRKQVEGPYHDPASTEPVPTYSPYPEAREAEQVVGVVGASNMFAAYFLGNIELIGGP